jgi:hypothetical protein
MRERGTVGEGQTPPSVMPSLILPSGSLTGAPVSRINESPEFKLFHEIGTRLTTVFMPPYKVVRHMLLVHSLAADRCAKVWARGDARSNRMVLRKHRHPTLFPSLDERHT